MRLVAATLAASALTGCVNGSTADEPATTATTAMSPTGGPPPSNTPTPSSTTTSTSTTTTTLPTPPPTFDATRSAFAGLVGGNPAVSLSVWRDGEPKLRVAHGDDRGGTPISTSTPMVVASVSKLITALTVARLAEVGLVDVGAPVPWVDLGLEPHLAWHDVTVRDLLDHTSGMPIVREAWLDDPGPCSIPLGEVVQRPPTVDRGRWVYSNGNYCALGLLIGAVTGDRYDIAAHRFVFGPAGVDGPRLTIDGAAPSDAPYGRGVARFDRLGAAGSWLAGTDHVAAVLARVTDRDLDTMRWPGIFSDQYGWGHTGTVAGATSCAWVLEEGRTVVAGIVAGGRPSTGGGICDVLLPALAVDLGLGDRGRPERSPR